MEMKTTSQIEIGFEFHELTLDSCCGINITYRFILKTTTESAIAVFPHHGPGDTSRVVEIIMIIIIMIN